MDRLRIRVARSVIRRASVSRPTTDVQRAYIGQVHRAYDCGIDTQLELMTHRDLSILTGIVSSMVRCMKALAARS